MPVPSSVHPKRRVLGDYSQCTGVLTDLVVSVSHVFFKPLLLGDVNLAVLGVVRIFYKELGHVGLDVDEHVQHASVKIVPVHPDDVLCKAEDPLARSLRGIGDEEGPRHRRKGWINRGT